VTNPYAFYNTDQLRHFIFMLQAPQHSISTFLLYSRHKYRTSAPGLAIDYQGAAVKVLGHLVRTFINRLHGPHSLMAS
jgi:hypothetical protein